MTAAYWQVRARASALCMLVVLFCAGASSAFAQKPTPFSSKTRISDAKNATFAGNIRMLPESSRIAAIGLDKPPDFPQSPPNLIADEKAGVPTQALPNYKPITGRQRFNWFVKSTVGPTSLFLSGPASAAWGTMLNSPKEYGPHWEGFAARYGMRLTGISTGNAMEAALGAIWKEDPRYFRSQNRNFGARVWHVFATTFTAPRPDGRFHPAYARYAGNLFNNFLSNTWRVPSESDADDAALRCVWGVLGRMAGNALKEFWPDVRKAAFRK
ncbi:MAG TPA: hypothetical protein VNJ12_03400 [Candidatus Dormibacteraeota bacterium]|nr:hypothetical protein [Candidatus Dormibacteraeota bacterium]